ncbi:hypothetical protein LOCC1_G002193 [Lachnellula occidentalis]|uniref:Cyclopropane-fatty-acyl-phospholipid synthase n=1 Tax=Lachnellula occidentalis TaxID=215460 RepID=A0A8H8S4V4_9HELO|nr:hypothetical protein LOCC1_G002193 [Lachnellula occidentalis]
MPVQHQHQTQGTLEMAASIAFPPVSITLGLFSYFGTPTNLFLFFLFCFMRKEHVILEFLDVYINPTIVIYIISASVALFLPLQVFRLYAGLNACSSSTDGFPAKPMFFPCRTAHTRMFPTKHSFSYSYLLAGIPVGWGGSTGGMISSDIENRPISWYRRLFSFKSYSPWFTVNGDDYFERGHVKGGLEEKLRNYLHSQGIDPSEFAHAYLFTAARFLNYASNPVSIWNLYSRTKELTATILEVGNTFDEKHRYFLRPKANQKPDTEITNGPKFSQSWPKDFYVSVFNSRAGAYSLSTTDALFPDMSGTESIVNTTITLSSSSGKPKLIARLFSTEPAIDPSSMSVLQKLTFLASWWWVGFATFFPRTVFQALILLFKKKLPWAFRPEPRKDTLSRQAVETEVFTEGIFRLYLRYFVHHSPVPMKLSYIPAGLVDTSGEVMTSPSVQLVAEDEVKELELRVLTPLFYSRYVKSPSCLHALILESQLLNSTISLSNPELVSKFAAAQIKPPTPPTFSSFWEDLSFSFLRNLRTEAGIIQNYETKCQMENQMIEALPEIKDKKRISELERFVLKAGTSTQRLEYIRRVGKLYLADRIALGWVEILDLEVFVVKAGVLWWVVKTLV